MKNNNLILIVIGVVVVAGVAFFGGMKYQQRQVQSGRSGLFGANGQFQRGTGRQGFRPVDGQIISVDANGITVKLTDGTSRIVILSGSTSINKSQTAIKDDLKVGETVVVFGTDNSDGSVTAQSVSINPQSGRGLRGSSSPSASPSY